MLKQKITKEMVVDAALEIARKDGMDKATVKAIAERLGCSVQPIYSYCQNMEGLKNDVIEKASAFIRAYVSRAIDHKDLFRSTGHAYIRIAKEEPHLFRLYLFQERDNISSLEDLYRTEANPDVAELIADGLNLSVAAAKRLHLNMLIYTIGIGTIFSVTSSGISENEIFRQQEQAYRAFLRFTREGTRDES